MPSRVGFHSTDVASWLQAKSLGFRFQAHGDKCFKNKLTLCLVWPFLLSPPAEAAASPLNDSLLDLDEFGFPTLFLPCVLIRGVISIWEIPSLANSTELFEVFPFAVCLVLLLNIVEESSLMKTESFSKETLSDEEEQVSAGIHSSLWANLQWIIWHFPELQTSKIQDIIG